MDGSGKILLYMELLYVYFLFLILILHIMQSQETGTKITVQGKGAVKEGKV